MISAVVVRAGRQGTAEAGGGLVFQALCQQVGQRGSVVVASLQPDQAVGERAADNACVHCKHLNLDPVPRPADSAFRR